MILTSKSKQQEADSASTEKRKFHGHMEKIRGNEINLRD